MTDVCTRKGKIYLSKRGNRYRKLYKEKIKARNLINRLIRDGKIERSEKCDMENEYCSGQIEAHHPDYFEPLDVIWLCHYHHRKIEGRNVYQV